MIYKRGTSFDYTGVLKNSKTKAVVPMVGWTVEAQLRKEVGGRADELIAELVATVIDADAGVYQVKAESIVATLSWPLCNAVFDIVFVTSAGDRLPIDGFVKVKIIDPATRASA